MLQIRTFTGASITDFLSSPEAAHLGTGNSLPESGKYAIITDAATGTADTHGGLGVILTQVEKDGNFYAISFASRQLKDHKKNYSPFLLEAEAAV